MTDKRDEARERLVAEHADLADRFDRICRAGGTHVERLEARIAARAAWVAILNYDRLKDNGGRR